MSLGYRLLSILYSLGEAKIVDTWTVNPAQSVHVYMDLALLVTYGYSLETQKTHDRKQKLVYFLNRTGT